MLPSHSLHWRTHYDNSQCHGMILFNFRFCVYLCYQVLLCKCKQVTGFVNVAVGLCPHVLFIICLSYSDICRTQRMRPKDQMLLRSCNWWPRCVPNVITCLLFWKFQRWDSGRPILRWCKSRFCKCVFPFSAKGILKLETEEKCKFTFLDASSPKAELKYKCQQRLPGLAPYFLFKAVFELPSKEWHQVPANMHILCNLYLYGRSYVHVSTKGRNYTLAKEPVLVHAPECSRTAPSITWTDWNVF